LNNAKHVNRSAGDIFRHSWNEFTAFVIPFLFDLAKGGIILLALFLISWLLHLGKLFGLDDAYLQAFERLHFWANYATYLVISLDFLVRLIRGAFGKNE